eukprot:2835653-Pleurochrysis_carterae.AAC.2
MRVKAAPNRRSSSERAITASACVRLNGIGASVCLRLECEGLLMSQQGASREFESQEERVWKDGNKHKVGNSLSQTILPCSYTQISWPLRRNILSQLIRAPNVRRWNANKVQDTKQQEVRSTSTSTRKPAVPLTAAKALRIQCRAARQMARLLLVWRDEPVERAEDVARAERRELCAPHAHPRVGAHAHLHHLEADRLALSVAVEPQKQIRAPLRRLTKCVHAAKQW